MLCLYHGNCIDGFASAVVAKMYFDSANEKRECRFQGIQHGDLPPDVSGEEVYILDFSFPRETLVEMEKYAKKVTVIDHHKSAIDDLVDLSFAIFDLSKSGCILTWEYFFPRLPIPKLLEYVQDRDLWQWNLPFSKEINAALWSYDLSFEKWEELLNLDSLELLKTEGKAILRYQNRYIDLMLSRPPDFVTLEGHTVPCINTTALSSELGNELSKDYPFAITYFDRDGLRYFSLRSSENGIDVSKIAELYGGGGHLRAAGFKMKQPEIVLNNSPSQ